MLTLCLVALTALVTQQVSAWTTSVRHGYPVCYTCYSKSKHPDDSVGSAKGFNLLYYGEGTCNMWAEYGLLGNIQRHHCSVVQYYTMQECKCTSAASTVWATAEESNLMVEQEGEQFAMAEQQQLQDDAAQEDFSSMLVSVQQYDMPAAPAVPAAVTVATEQTANPYLVSALVIGCVINFILTVAVCVFRKNSNAQTYKL